MNRDDISPIPGQKKAPRQILLPVGAFALYYLFVLTLGVFFNPSFRNTTPCSNQTYRNEGRMSSLFSRNEGKPLKTISIVPIPVGDRQSPVFAKGPGRYLYARRRLSSLVLIPIDPVYDVLDNSFFKTEGQNSL
jgi:hypothetical protein